MSYFAAVLARAGDAGRRRGRPGRLRVAGPISPTSLRDAPASVRLLVVEQDDEYAAIVRVDDDDDEPRAFLSDGHAADALPDGGRRRRGTRSRSARTNSSDDEDAPPAHDSAPFGDADIVEDLGTSAADLLAMCAHEGTLPIDVLVAVCERAGCAEAFEDLRG